MGLDLQNSAGRQWPLIAKLPISYEDFADGLLQKAVVMPGNSRVVGGGLVIEEAFDADTTVNVGDEDDADRYAAAVDATEVGHTALTIDGHKYTGKDTIDVVMNQAVTQGSAMLYVMYMMEDRATEVQPAVLDE